jgi:predicted unusual protein kinase regulating ubiquinone biosynthesis (AarF/ABC1/UbiB family)
MREAGWSRTLFAETVAQFERDLERQIDFRLAARDLDDLAHSEAEGKQRGTPRIYPALCGPTVLTVERLPGKRLDDVLSGDGSMWGKDPARPTQRSYPAAVAVCVAWLDRVFDAGVFPASPTPDRVVVSTDGSVAFAAGPAVKLLPKERACFWDYLVASANHRPVQACQALLGEMQADEARGEAKDLEHRIRQVVPFRDGGWSDPQADDTLPEHLFLHWRAAIQQGYRPNPGLASFMRGLFLCARTAHLLAPEGDPFADAFVVLQNRLEAREMRDMAEPGYCADTLDRYAAALVELPQKLDQLLTRAAAGDVKLDIRIRETVEHRRRRNASAVIISLLFLLVSVVVVAYHLSGSAAGGIWVDRIGAALFVLLGASLLWAVTRA